ARLVDELDRGLRRRLGDRVLGRVLDLARDLLALVLEPRLEDLAVVELLDPSEEHHQADERCRERQRQFGADLQEGQSTPGSLRGWRTATLARMEPGTKMGAMHIDPVCGMQVAPGPDTPRSEHAGRSYWFCCASCLQRFQAEPERFLAPRETRNSSATTRRAGAGSYTCPMHPEIRRDGPGDCPKCGMALEPLVPSAEEEPELASMRTRIKLAAALTTPLVLLAMA